jgi:NitT/TauT family transport system permease protein
MIVMHQMVKPFLISAGLSLGGLLFGVCMALVLLPLSTRWKGAVIGSTFSIGLKSVPAFIIPLMIGPFLGPGPTVKMIVSGLICFFPVLVGAQEGLSRVPRGLIRMADAYGSRGWAKFWLIERPWLTVGLLEGIKAAAPLAVVGAVVAEFVDAARASQAGLGVLFAVNRNYPGTLVGLSLATTVLGCLLFALCAALHRLALKEYQLDG